MSVLLQQVVVGALVIACALFAAWRLATARLRLRMLAILDATPGVRALPWLTRLRQRTLAAQLAACGGCSQAQRHSPTERTSARPDAPSPNQTPGALRR